MKKNTRSTTPNPNQQSQRTITPYKQSSKMGSPDKSIMNQPTLKSAIFFRMESIDSSYEGDISKNYKKQGCGITLFDDGLLYVGSFINDDYEGEGLLCMPFGSLLFGNYLKNTANGPGILLLQRVRLMITNFHQSHINGVCYELDYSANMWLINHYTKGILVRCSKQIFIKEGNSKFRNPPNELIQDLELYRVYNRFLDKNFMFVSQNQETSSKLKQENKLDYIDQGNDQWFLGICKNGLPNGLGVTFENWEIKSIGGHIGHHYDNIVIQHQDSKTICHSYYQDNKQQSQVFHQKQDKLNHEIQCLSYDLKTKIESQTTINKLRQFKSLVHKKSPYFNAKANTNSNKKDYDTIYELDETSYRNSTSIKIQEINNKLYTQQSSYNLRDPKKIYQMEDLTQKYQQDGFTQKPLNTIVIQHQPKPQPKKVKKEEIIIPLEPTVDLTKLAMQNTHKEIEKYKQFKIKLLQNEKKTKIPIFQQLETQKYEIYGMKTKPQIFNEAQSQSPRRNQGMSSPNRSQRLSPSRSNTRGIISPNLIQTTNNNIKREISTSPEFAPQASFMNGTRGSSPQLRTPGIIPSLRSLNMSRTRSKSSMKEQRQ